RSHPLPHDLSAFACPAVLEAAEHGKKTKSRKIRRPKTTLGLPDLDQSKAALISSLQSPESQPGYRHAINEFVDWYGSEPSEARPLWRSPDAETLKGKRDRAIIAVLHGSGKYQRQSRQSGLGAFTARSFPMLRSLRGSGLLMRFSVGVINSSYLRQDDHT